MNMGIGFTGTHLSMSFRFYIEKAAINAVESVGNIIRHRRGTVARLENGKLKLVTVPTISAECLKHAFQLWLAALAEKYGESVCEWCRRGEFVKHGVPDLYQDQQFRNLISQAKQLKDPTAIEEHVIRSCIVEDIGGFLIPIEVPVKRTSKIEFSFAVPTYDAIEKGLCRIEMDFHVRHAPTAMLQNREAQAIYYVENVTGIFGFVTNLDVSYIGKTTSYIIRDVTGIDRRKRVELAIRALQTMLVNGAFGAKRGYYHPSKYCVLSAIAVVSKPIPVVVHSGVDPNYMVRTIEKVEKLKKMFSDEQAEVLYYVDDSELDEVKEQIKKIEGKAKKCSSIEELFEKIKEVVMSFEFGSS